MCHFKHSGHVEGGSFIYHRTPAGVRVNGTACSAEHTGSEHGTEAAFSQQLRALELRKDYTRFERREALLIFFSLL